MKTNLELCVVPWYIIAESEKYLSDKELKIVLQFTAVQEKGKKSFEVVAERVGYSNVSYLITALDKLAEKGLIKVDGYEIDASPLFEKCRLSSTSKPVNKSLVNIAEKPKSAKKNNVQGHILYSNLYSILGGNKYVWVNALQTLLEASTGHAATLEGKSVGVSERLMKDIECFIKYLVSFIENRDKGKAVSYAITPSLVSMVNFQKWLDGGKKMVYTDEKKGKIDIEDVLRKL